MNGKNGDKRGEIAADLRRQLGSEATQRFLRAMPAFRLETDMPKHFRELLDRLDRADAKPAGGGG
ncbi:hypothetical protein FJ987_18420, partial [Mesorhizobium sp. CU2]|uniref:hypothetical protein n=1 Tax=Mesorhizobium sp. CU2 TaxID=2589985 RepID=UPI00112A9AFD